MARKIYGTGVNQGDLVDLLVLLRTNYVAVLAKLDADALVTDTDYLSLGTVAIPVGIQRTGTKGIGQDALYTFLKNYKVAFNATLVKLDADLTTTLNASYALSLGTLKPSGMYQGAVVRFLNSAVVNFNAMNAVLDGDGGVTGTDYRSLWNITDTVVEAGTKA